MVRIDTRIWRYIANTSMFYLQGFSSYLYNSFYVIGITTNGLFLCCHFWSWLFLASRKTLRRNAFTKISTIHSIDFEASSLEGIGKSIKLGFELVSTIAKVGMFNFFASEENQILGYCKCKLVCTK